MATREADRPLQRYWGTRGRSASLPSSYTTGRGTTHFFGRPKATPPVVEAEAPLDMAREALIQVEAVDGLDLLADAMVALARLSPDELALLRETMPFRPIVQAAEGAGQTAPPDSWIAWLGRVAGPGFTNVLEIARQGKDEWEIGASAADPIAVDRLDHWPIWIPMVRFAPQCRSGQALLRTINLCFAMQGAPGLMVNGNDAVWSNDWKIQLGRG